MVVMISSPIQSCGYFRLGRELDSLHDVFAEFFKSRTVHDITDMLLMFYGIGIYIFFNVGVGILNDFEDAFLVAPFDEVLSEARISLSGSAEQNKPEVVFFAP